MTQTPDDMDKAYAAINELLKRVAELEKRVQQLSTPTPTRSHFE